MTLATSRAGAAWAPVLALDLDELDVEVECLAGHLVVHVKGDVAVLHHRHHGGEGLAGRGRSG